MFAVVNLGLKSIRLCVVDSDAHIRYKRSHPLHSVIFGEAVEQDGEEWWRLVIRLFQEAEAAGVATEKIRAITVSASSSCLVCVGERGELLRPIIMVNDRRHRHFEASGTPVMIQRMRWLAHTEPEIHQRTAWFLSPNDFLIYRMTGVAATDPLNAEKFGYDPRCSQYVGCGADELRRLPGVLAVGSAVAELHEDVASLFRVGRGTKVFVSSYDAVVSVIGSGAVEVGDLCDVSGTVTSIRMVSTATSQHPTGAIFTQSAPVPGLTYVGGSTNLGGGLIEWLKTTFYPPHEHVYEHIDADVRDLPPDQCPLIFLPYLLGERAPLWDSDARGVFFGLERSHGRRHFARATLEGAALMGRSLIEEIVAVHGTRPRRIRLSGGLSRLGAASQIKADVYGQPLEVVAEFESTVMGSFLLGFQSELVKRRPLTELFHTTVRSREIVLPDSGSAALYERKYEIFRELYQTLKPQFAKLRTLPREELKSEDGMLENL
ncbi:MAG: FGGY-family carbohydrate kinase [Candidatus Didemnitutus sp.]|nr:FGGY-family carbohydrate kinase [Candidatus Didemnitutus sp.]